MNSMEHSSELRKDLVSGDWVVIATGRAKRPQDFLEHKSEPFAQPKDTCPFEGADAESLALYSNGGGTRSEWKVAVIPNKYPAFVGGICPSEYSVGPYQSLEGIGFHELVVSRDHERAFAEMTDADVELVVRAYQERFSVLKKEPCVAYISIFSNHGKKSGASISHPHSQIIAIPVVPPDIGRSLAGSAVYFKEHQTCVHCAMLEYEIQNKVRVIYENELFVAFAPYASRTAFEVRIFPKKHSAWFEDMGPGDRLFFAGALRASLAKLHKGLGDPDYNFFLHTAPVGDRKNFDHYHWHLEIIPKTSIWAGFEIGTGIDISVIAPETAAGFLRETVV